MKAAYIIALTDALLTQGDVAAVLKNTKQVIERKGHGRLWPAVLRGTLQALEKKSAHNVPRVTVSDKTNAPDAKIKQALALVGAEAGATYQTAEDNTLIGGFVLRYKDRLLDSSYKRALMNLYQQITK